MSYTDYSFLDLTVMGFLRKRVICQDAVVLFSQELDQVLWANAYGAQLFSGNNVAELLQSKPSPAHPLIRQIENASRQVDGDEPVVRRLRVNHGLKSELLVSEVSQNVLPNGEKVILLVCPCEEGQKRMREHQLASAAVTSLEKFARASAILDEFGLVLAASEDFEDLEIDPQELEALVHEVGNEADRLVKRMVRTGKGEALPAGLGKIRDNPVRILAVLADDAERGLNSDAETVETHEDNDGLLWDELPRDEQPREGLPEPSTAVSAPGATVAGASIVSHVLNHTSDDADAREELYETQPDDEQSEELSRGFSELAEEAEEIDDLQHSTEFEDGTNRSFASTQHINDELVSTRASEEADDRDQKYDLTIAPELIASTELDGDQSDEITQINEPHDETEDEAEQENPEADDEEEPGADNESGSNQDNHKVERFAFSIDRNQVVRSLSDGLARIVGKKSADIAGRPWAEIAEERGLDENGTISKLLSKGDTWSGRSVLWPIEGTDMAVPVELAALPSYGKDREFDGFRGFGVIRTADTIVDPNAFGMRLAGGDATDPMRQDVDDDVPDRQLGVDKGPDEEDRDHSDPSELSSDDASSDAFIHSVTGRHFDERDNVYQLNGRHNFARMETDEDEIVSHRQTARPDNLEDSGLETSEVDLTSKLSGSERRNFKTIQRTLSDDELDPDSANDEARAIRLANTGLEDDYSPAHIIVRRGEPIFVNRALLDLAGYKSQEEFDEAGGVDGLFCDLDIDEDNILSVGNQAKERAMFILNKNGQKIPVSCRLHRLDWKGEKALSLVFAEKNTKLADEKIALDMVRVSELENMLDTAADGIMIIDKNGKILSLNASGEALFGHLQSEISHKHFTSLFAKEDEQALREYASSMKLDDADIAANMVRQGCEATGIEAQGRLIPLFVTLGKVGREGNLCAVLRDLTAWKLSEEQLVSARRDAETASDQKTEFLSRVSHEIREPLTTIIGFSDIMLEERFGKIDNERYRDYLQGINRSGVHVLDLVNDLMDISKIEAGKLELSFEAVDLNRIVAETTSLLQPQSASRRVLMRTSLSNAVPKVVADVRSIRQVLLNLIGNSINHSPENTQVIVSTVLEENGEVGLRVRDTGNGLTPEELEDIMQVHSTPNDHKPGNEDVVDVRIVPVKGKKATSRTGLGLPLTKALVEANRAYMEIESTPGEGTVVHVIFPSQRVLDG